jgi:hypothetical protein
MTALKVLPARPSLASIHKQAKRLARDIAAANADAVARARAQLPNTELPLSQRDAQLVLARKYGFAGWQDLKGEVLKRQGKGPEWAAAQAHRAIHDNDVEYLKQLVAEYPMLLDRCIALDEDLGRQIERWTDRATFIERLGSPSASGPEAPAITPWRVFVMHELGRAIGQNDLSAFARWLQSQS